MVQNQNALLIKELRGERQGWFEPTGRPPHKKTHCTIMVGREAPKNAKHVKCYSEWATRAGKHLRFSPYLP